MEGESGGLIRILILQDRQRRTSWKIRTDASTTGMAGILYNEYDEPKAFWADDITDGDLKRFGSARGDPSYMAEWEILAVLVSLKIWINYVKAAQTQLVVQTDSTAAMGAALKLASPRPLVNAVAAEITLMLEATRADLLVPQPGGVLNLKADALSRLNEGKEVPRRLTQVHREVPPVRNEDFYKAWPKEWKDVTILHS